MELTPVVLMIICPLMFIGGIVDAIGGGGGLITIPAFLFAGVPIHAAIATNKLSSSCGTLVATVRFIKNGLVNAKLAIPAIAAAIIGSSLGAYISIQMDESLMKYILLVVLPIAALIVFNKNLFKDHGEDGLELNKKIIITAVMSAFTVGIYDGLYGPGTGTFLIIAFTVFAKLGVGSANAQAKVINLTTNITALAVFLLNDQVIIILGLIAAACNMAGNYIGSGLAMKNGTKITRPIILVVLILLAGKLLMEGP